MLPGIAPILSRMLRRDTAHRYPDIRSVAADLRQLALRYPVTRDMAEVLAAMFPQVQRTAAITIDDTSALRTDISLETHAWEVAEQSADLHEAQTLLARALSPDAEHAATGPPSRPEYTAPPTPTPQPMAAADTPGAMADVHVPPARAGNRARMLVIGALIGLSLLVVVLGAAVVVLLTMMG